jgi:hypothetical protein
MGDENLHWSERARLANPSGFPPPMPLPGSQPPPPRGRKKLVIGGLGLVLVLAIVIVLVAYAPWDRSPAGAPGPSVATPSTAAPTVTTLPTSTTQSWTSVPAGTILYEEPVTGFNFEYPSSWMEFSPERLVGATAPLPGSIGVGDPNGASFGTTPANCVAFVPFVLTEEELRETQEDPGWTVASELEEASQYWGSMAPEDYALEVVEPATNFTVNGLGAAEMTYRLMAQGHPLRMRLVFAESGKFACTLFMYTEEPHMDRYWPVFDALIDSLRLGDAI